MKRYLTLLAIIALVGCESEMLNGPDADLARRDGGGSAFPAPLRVLSRNVFIGADVDRVLAAGSAEEIPALVAEIYPQLFENDFHDRAVALAREIRRTRPDLIGLQEISTVRLQSPGDAALGGTIPAEDVVFDYLQILTSTLAEMDLRYRVAGVVQNVDIEVAMLVGQSPLQFDDVRLTDYDVILAREDVEIGDVEARNFQARLSIPLEGLSIDIPRGYVAVTARKGRTQVRFVNTHLEPLSVPQLEPLQRAQAAELLGAVASAADPVVIVGDLNSDAPDGATYQDLLGAGFIDAWTNGPQAGRPGLTCCHALTLDNEVVAFDQRIDLVMLRGSAELPAAEVLQTRVVGHRWFERTSAGRWPSDHAGLYAAFQFRPVVP